MRRSTFLGAVLASGAFLSGCSIPHSVAARRDVRTLRIASVGDSLSIGVGATAPEAAFVFRSYLNLKTLFPSADLVCFGEDGATVADVRRAQLLQLRRYVPDVVIACVGLVDLATFEDPVAFSYEYDALLKSIRHGNAGAAVICCGIVNLGSAWHYPELQRGALLEARDSENTAIRRLATTNRCVFAPATVRDSPLRRGEVGEDGWHPNDEGYAAMSVPLSAALISVASATAARRHHGSNALL